MFWVENKSKTILFLDLRSLTFIEKKHTICSEKVTKIRKKGIFLF